MGGDVFLHHKVGDWNLFSYGKLQKMDRLKIFLDAEHLY